jgi:hypothetical protein
MERLHSISTALRRDEVANPLALGSRPSESRRSLREMKLLPLGGDRRCMGRRERWRRSLRLADRICDICHLIADHLAPVLIRELSIGDEHGDLAECGVDPHAAVSILRPANLYARCVPVVGNDLASSRNPRKRGRTHRRDPVARTPCFRGPCRVSRSSAQSSASTAAYERRPATARRHRVQWDP